MKRFLWTVSFIISVGIFAANAEASVMTFEDLYRPPDTRLGPIPDNYRGFSWTGWIDVISDPRVIGTRGIHLLSSASPFTNPVLISNDHLFDFEGAYVGMCEFKNDVITVTGMRGGDIIYTAYPSLTTDLLWIDFDFLNIDTIQFNTHMETVIVDNIKYDVDRTRVPEPSILLMILGGLAGSGLLKRRLERS